MSGRDVQDQSRQPKLTEVSDDQTAPVASGHLFEPLTSFVGRKDDIRQVLELIHLSTVRLVTLTGPGGVGKTRLAIEVARAVADGGTTTVVFVPLASVRDPSLVGATIGAAFGVSDSPEQSLPERLSVILQEAPLLLVLDNFEHVVEAAPVLRLLLDACPNLRILTTSRRLLHLSGEVEYVVPPLATTSPDASRETVESSPAWQLFSARSPGGAGGALSSAESAAIGEICRRLDGLPLAIELAAARTRVLPPAELLKRLNRRFTLLVDGPVDAPSRLRSLRDAIAWSYDLLSEEEQQLFRRLSVFSGGFTLEAVEAIAPDDLQRSALDLLANLNDHNLVRRMETPAETARFTMLETIREFALELLGAHGEETDARNRHLTWFVEFVGSPTPDRFYEMRGPADAILYDELNNLRLAFTWGIDHHDASRAAQIAWGLLRVWWHFGLTAEAFESTQRLIDHPEGLDPVVHAIATEWIASLAIHHGDPHLGKVMAARALDMFREMGYPLGINSGLATLAEATSWSDPGKAVDLFDQAVDIGRTLEDKRMLAWDLHWRSYALAAHGEFQSAMTDLEEAIALFEQFQVDDEVRYDKSLAMNFMAWVWGLCGRSDLASECVARSLEFSGRFNVGFGIFAANRVLGELARQRGDFEQALACLQGCLLTAEREALESWKIRVIIQIAMLAQAAEEWRRAARLFGYTDNLWVLQNYAESVRAIATWGYTIEPTRTALGETIFAVEFGAGGRLSRSEALAEALSFTVPGNVRSALSILTRRESEVLNHLAGGKTNQEIAAELYVGKSTIDTHVSNILAKLGVESRRAAVRAARERGLLAHGPVMDAYPDP